LNPDPDWSPASNSGSGSGSGKNEYGSTTLVSETEEEIYSRKKPDVKTPFLSKIIIMSYYYYSLFYRK
jgi:hypothetical protein